MTLLSEGEIGQLVLIAEEEIGSASGPEELAALKVKYVGRSGILTLVLRSLKGVPAELRPKVGQALNAAKVSLEDKIDSRLFALQAAARRGQRNFFDYTLPGPPYPIGHPHPLTKVGNEIVRIFNVTAAAACTGRETAVGALRSEAPGGPRDHPARDM